MAILILMDWCQLKLGKYWYKRGRPHQCFMFYRDHIKLMKIV